MDKRIDTNGRDGGPRSAITPATFAFTVLLTILLVLWIQDTHFVRKAGNPAESIPPAIAVAAVLLSALVAGLVSRTFPFLTPSRRGLFYLYVSLIVAAPLAGIGLMERFIIMVTLLPYRGLESPATEEWITVLPNWWTPTDPAVIEGFYEGVAGGAVPWAAWAPMMTFWTLFLTGFFFWMFCIMSIFRRPWVDRERLVFPLADLPVRFAGGEGREPHYRTPVFWLGVAIAGLFQVFLIANHYFTLAPGFNGAISASFGTERPWNALGWSPGIGLKISFTVIGIAFLVNQEMTFSIWFTFLMIKLIQVWYSATGHTSAPFPNQNSLIGGFIAITLFCLWLARDHLLKVAAKSLGRPVDLDDSEEALPHRVAFWGFWIVTGLMIAALIFSGLSAWFAVAVILMLFMLVVTLARIRAESGAPIAWMSPWAGTAWTGFLFANMKFQFIPFTMADYVLGLILGFFTIGYYPLIGAAQAESLRIADSVGLSRRSVAVILHTVCVIVIVTSFIFCLTMFYDQGANALADFEVGVFWGQYTSLRGQMDLDASRLSRSMPALAGGAGCTTLLIVLRYVFLRFPIHPVGFLIAQTYGGNWMMGGVFVAWLIKALVLKYGGVKIFRKLVPLFVGLAVGEIAVVGIWFAVVRFTTGTPYLMAWG